MIIKSSYPISCAEPIPHYPQTVLEEAGRTYSRIGKDDPYVIKDGKTGDGAEPTIGVRICLGAASSPLWKKPGHGGLKWKCLTETSEE